MGGRPRVHLSFWRLPVLAGYLDLNSASVIEALEQLIAISFPREPKKEPLKQL